MPSYKRLSSYVDCRERIKFESPKCKLMKSIAIIGCGNLGLSIAEGLIDTPTQRYQVTATRRNLAAVSHLAESGVTLTSNNREAVRNSEVILLTVKPYNVESILKEVADLLDPGRHILVSAASGVTSLMIRHQVGDKLPVFRAMPNTATMVKESITCISHDNGTEEQLEAIADLFSHIGKSIIIEEHLMEAATVLGACGIAYAMRFIRAMTQGGIQIGFSAELASLIASQTAKGAAQLLLDRDSHPESEIDKVTTPKGCTIVGLNEMEHAGFSSSLIRGIVSSFEEIGK